MAVGRKNYLFAGSEPGTENLLRSTPRLDPFALDLFNPVYGQPKPPFTRRYSASENVGNTAVYAQDQIALSPEWKLLLGNRTDFYNQTFRDKVGGNAQSRTAPASRRAPGSSTSHSPSSRSTATGCLLPSEHRLRQRDEAFAPETGFGYEVGAKLDLFTGLSVTAAASTSRRRTSSPPIPRFLLPDRGRCRSQPGLRSELRRAGDARVPSDRRLRFHRRGGDARRGPAGRLATPQHPAPLGSLLGVYEVQGGDWKGFGIGGGVRAVGSRLVDSGNERFRLPGYVLADALVYYRYENLRFGLNVDNIFDATYYERSYNSFWVGVGEPRRVTVSMTARF